MKRAPVFRREKSTPVCSNAQLESLPKDFQSCADGTFGNLFWAGEGGSVLKIFEVKFCTVSTVLYVKYIGTRESENLVFLITY
jgi:hypothetical protein